MTYECVKRVVLTKKAKSFGKTSQKQNTTQNIADIHLNVGKKTLKDWKNHKSLDLKASSSPTTVEKPKLEMIANPPWSGLRKKDNSEV